MSLKSLHRVFSALIVAALLLSFQSLPASAQAPRPSGPSLPGSLSMLVPALNFDGVGNSSNLESVIPPDVNGDVGPGHYVQVVNNLYGVWNKEGENLFPYGPHSITEPFTGFGGLCEFSPGNGAMVLYDHLADRWVITYPAYGVGQYLQCIAVTKTPDPVNGGWYQYSFLTSTNKINDHPKLALWPDGYYITYDELNPADQTWVGQGIAVFEREKMLQGEPANFFSLDLKSFFPTSDLHDMLFADLDGAPPPAGTPAYLAQIIDGSSGNDQLEVMRVVPNWNTGAPPAVGNATFETVPDFDSNLCGSAACISQPDTSQKLDSLTSGFMNRLQYRYQGGNGYLVTNQTVNVGSGQAGIRWYQFSTSDNSNWSVADSGDFAPDGNNRWNGSAAMDASGNIAVGYSVSDGSTYPSIRYAGRLTGDTAGTLGQGEETLMVGAGSQTDASGAWGHYSSLTVDPVDQCTFWYTNEYIATTGSQTWQTQIGNFTYGIGDCAAPATYDVSGTVTDSSSNPIANAMVKTNTGFYAVTGNDGTYTLTGLPAGSVDITASTPRYSPSTQTVTVPVVGDVDFSLTSTTNDDINYPFDVTRPYSDTEDTSTYATRAGDDPAVSTCGLSSGYATVWYRYIANDNDLLYIDTYGSAFDTFIAVWSGTRGNLTGITCNNNANGTLQSSVALSASAGTTYYIEVGQADVHTPPGGALQFHVTSFADVPGNYWAWNWIEGLYKAGVTAGCSANPRNYCPGSPVTREQMAVFLLIGEHGQGYTPPAVGGSSGFNDVPISSGFAPWIKQLAAEGITAGCGGGNYCPTAPVTREQMAVFLLIAEHNTGYTPPAVGGSSGFNDVPISSGFAPWIKQLAAEGVTAGCGGGNYCPAAPVTRDQMAVFLSKAFSLPVP